MLLDLGLEWVGYLVVIDRVRVSSWAFRPSAHRDGFKSQSFVLYGFLAWHTPSLVHPTTTNVFFIVVCFPRVVHLHTCSCFVVHGWLPYTATQRSIVYITQHLSGFIWIQTRVSKFVPVNKPQVYESPYRDICVCSCSCYKQRTITCISQAKSGHIWEVKKFHLVLTKRAVWGFSPCFKLQVRNFG